VPRFEFIAGTSAKFWEIQREGASTTIRYGRIGTNGRTLTKQYPDEVEAMLAYDKAVAGKLAKGYQRVGDDAPSDGGGQASTPTPTPEAAVPTLPEGYDRVVQRWFCDAFGADAVAGANTRRIMLVQLGNRIDKRTTYLGARTDKSSWSTRRYPTVEAATRSLEAAVKRRKSADDRVKPAPIDGWRDYSASEQAQLDKLIDAVRAQPDDEMAYLVLGDWLMMQGDAWGRLITAQHHLLEFKQRPIGMNDPDRDVRFARMSQLRNAEDDVLKNYRLPVLRSLHAALPAPWAESSSARRHGLMHAYWHLGFIHSVTVLVTAASDIELVELLTHRAGAVLQTLTLADSDPAVSGVIPGVEAGLGGGHSRSGGKWLPHVAGILEAHAPPSLSRLVVRTDLKRATQVYLALLDAARAGHVWAGRLREVVGPVPRTPGLWDELGDALTRCQFTVMRRGLR